MSSMHALMKAVRALSPPQGFATSVGSVLYTRPSSTRTVPPQRPRPRLQCILTPTSPSTIFLTRQRRPSHPSRYPSPRPDPPNLKKRAISNFDGVADASAGLAILCVRSCFLRPSVVFSQASGFCFSGRRPSVRRRPVISSQAPTRILLLFSPSILAPFLALSLFLVPPLPCPALSQPLRKPSLYR